MFYAPLARSLLALHGEDTRSFLQGLLTIDTRTLSPEHAAYGFLLSPQGKYLHEMFIVVEGERLLLDVPSSRIEELRKRLMLYRLRAKVEMAEEKALGVYALWDGISPSACGRIIADPRLGALGSRLYSAAAPTGEAGDYEAHRLSLGVPDEHDFIIDRSLPLEWGMDALHAVDFAKGCYVGQEVTARMHHRAVIRHYVHQVQADVALPPAGTPVLMDGKEVGTLHSTHENRGLARLSVEAAERAARGEEKLLTGNLQISAHIPGWAKIS